MLPANPLRDIMDGSMGTWDDGRLDTGHLDPDDLPKGGIYWSGLAVPATTRREVCLGLCQDGTKKKPIPGNGEKLKAMRRKRWPSQ